MTQRGRRVLWLALGLYLAAWGFGTDAMFPVAVGLALAPAVAWGWVGLLDRPMRLRRRAGHLELVEGQSFAVGLEVSADGGPLPGRAVVVDRVGDRPVGAQVIRTGRVLRGRYEVASALRGRYRLGGAELVIGDGFGLAEARIALDRSDEVIVYPRVYPLEGLFTDAGGSSGEHGRALLHRTAGYDLHSIRDHQQGESLRRVHWRSTAKRRKLMVKELQDTPRDEASVLLDGDMHAVAGEAPESTFDYQVRAAASLLHRLVESGQRSSLVIHGAAHTRIRVGDGGGDWATALGALAGVEPDAHRSLATALGESAHAATRVDASRVFVVTAAMSPALAERLLGLRSSQRDIAVVWVDAPDFAGNGEDTAQSAAALRLTRSGIPLARVRQDDDVGRALSAPTLRLVVASA
jgi:uncharacterized protein (DUF58 family)